MAKFYYRDENDAFGPFEADEIIDFGIPLSMLVKKEGCEDWMRAGDHRELNALHKVHAQAKMAHDTTVHRRTVPRQIPIGPCGPNLFGRIILFVLGLGFGFLGLAGIAGYVKSQNPSSAVIGGLLAFSAVTMFYMAFKKRRTISIDNCDDAAAGIKMAHIMNPNMNLNDYCGDEDGFDAFD